MSKLTPPEKDNSSIPTPETVQGKNPSQLLQEFLQANNIELRLTPPQVRMVDGGGLMIEQPQVVANFKQIDSIKKN